MLAKLFTAWQNGFVVFCHMPETGNSRLTGDDVMANWGRNLRKGRRKMTVKTHAFITAFLICTFLVGGCGSSAKSHGPRVSGEIRELTLAEEQKAELLRKVDRKFENPQAHFKLGKLYHEDGLWTQAEYHYNVALAFDPAYRPAQAAMVKLFIDSQNIQRSQLYADIYMNQVSASAAGSLRLGLAFQREGLDDYALACYQQALNLAPDSAKVNRQVGYYYLSKNDKARAQDYLMRSFRLNPNQPEVAGELGRLGVAVKIPRKTQTGTKKLDKIVEDAEQE